MSAPRSEIDHVLHRIQCKREEDIKSNRKEFQKSLFEGPARLAQGKPHGRINNSSVFADLLHSQWPKTHDSREGQKGGIGAWKHELEHIPDESADNTYVGRKRGEERQGLGEQGQRHRRPRPQSADVPLVAVVGRVGLQDVDVETPRSRAIRDVLRRHVEGDAMFDAQSVWQDLQKVGVADSQLHSLSLLNTLKRFQDTGNPKFGPLLKALHMSAWPTKDLCAGNFHRESVVDVFGNAPVDRGGRGQIVELEVPPSLQQAPGGRIGRRRAFFDPPPPKSATFFKTGSFSPPEGDMANEAQASFCKKTVEKPLYNSNVFGAEWSRTELSVPPNRTRPSSAPAQARPDTVAAGGSLIRGPIKAVRFAIPSNRSTSEPYPEPYDAVGTRTAALPPPPLPPPGESLAKKSSDQHSEARQRAAVKQALSSKKVLKSQPKKKAQNDLDKAQDCFSQPAAPTRKKQLQFFGLKDYT